jgi:hypothetical protein
VLPKGSQTMQDKKLLAYYNMKDSNALLIRAMQMNRFVGV